MGDAGEDGWRVLTPPTDRPHRPASARRVVIQVAVIAAVAVATVAAVDVLAARSLAEADSVRTAASAAEFAAGAVAPNLTDGIIRGDPGALAALDADVRRHVLTDPSVVRVKVWGADGTILYSDEPRIIGQRFPLGADEIAAFATDRTASAVSDLQAPENVYERDKGTLLEAYRRVATGSGQFVLFEVYSRYDVVLQRSGELWFSLTALTVGSIIVLLLLLTPVLWQLLRGLRGASRERERLLERSLEASAAERRRIAGALHDGAVQDLAGTALALSGAASAARRDGAEATADRLDEASATVRGTVAGLRTLLLDIYPPSLDAAGLHAALEDLAAALRSRGLAVELAAAPSGLDRAGERVVFRIVREVLGNVWRHARATTVRVAVGTDADGRVLAEVTDDGVGFDVDAALAHPESGHFGLRVLADTAADAGAQLSVRSAPGAGTAWRLRMAPA